MSNPYMKYTNSQNERRDEFIKQAKSCLLFFIVIPLLIGCVFAFLLKAGDGSKNAIKTETAVYICTGPQSKRYHKTKDCMGLGSCSKEVRTISLSDAKKSRTPCRYCY